MSTAIGLLIILGVIVLTSMVRTSRTRARKAALGDAPATSTILVSPAIDNAGAHARLRAAAARAGLHNAGVFGSTYFLQTKRGLHIEASVSSTGQGTEVRVARTGVRTEAGRPIAVDAHRRFLADLTSTLTG